MYKTQVDVMDAIVAAQLVGTVPTQNDIGCPFPEDPQAAYDQEGKKYFIPFFVLHHYNVNTHFFLLFQQGQF